MNTFKLKPHEHDALAQAPRHPQATRLSRASRPEPLAEVDLLVLFSPRMQGGSIQKPSAEVLTDARHCWVSARVYGTPARSALMGDICGIDDFRIEDSDGNNLEPLLSDAVLDDITAYALQN